MSDLSTPDSDGSDRSNGRSLLRGANRLLQLGILTTLRAGVERRDPSVIVNAVLSVAFAVAPDYVERRFGVRFRPWHRLWISAAGVIHSVGMLGPYDRIWWWDRVAHTMSGAVVAGGADVLFQAIGGDAERPAASRSRAAFVLGVTLGLGVVWEVVEYTIHVVGRRVGFEPLLVNYGPLDTAGDLVCDILGAGLVIAFGRRTLSTVAESIAAD